MSPLRGWTKETEEIYLGAYKSFMEQPLMPKSDPEEITHREKILRTAIEFVTENRNSTYGEPEDSFKVIGDFWTVYIQRKKESEDRHSISDKVVYIGPHDVAIMMILLKVARLIEAPNHQDSWIDIAGYAACGAESIGRIVEP